MEGVGWLIPLLLWRTAMKMKTILGWRYCWLLMLTMMVHYGRGRCCYMILTYWRALLCIRAECSPMSMSLISDLLLVAQQHGVVDFSNFRFQGSQEQTVSERSTRLVERILTTPIPTVGPLFVLPLSLHPSHSSKTFATPLTNSNAPLSSESVKQFPNDIPSTKKFRVRCASLVVPRDEARWFVI
jgi:hypothetical protein